MSFQYPSQSSYPSFTPQSSTQAMSATEGTTKMDMAMDVTEPTQATRPSPSSLSTREANMAKERKRLHNKAMRQRNLSLPQMNTRPKKRAPYRGGFIEESYETDMASINATIASSTRHVKYAWMTEEVTEPISEESQQHQFLYPDTEVYGRCSPTASELADDTRTKETMARNRKRIERNQQARLRYERCERGVKTAGQARSQAGSNRVTKRAPYNPDVGAFANALAFSRSPDSSESKHTNMAEAEMWERVKKNKVQKSKVEMDLRNARVFQAHIERKAKRDARRTADFQRDEMVGMFGALGVDGKDKQASAAQEGDRVAFDFNDRNSVFRKDDDDEMEL